MSRNRRWLVVFLLTLFAMLFVACTTTPPDTLDNESQAAIEELERQLTAAAESGVDAQALQDELATARALLEQATEEPTAEPETTDRTGGWLDTIVFVEEPSAEQAISRLEQGDIELYSFTVNDADIAAQIEASDVVDAEQSFGSYNDITFNTYGPTFDDGRLNPFSSPRIREAMNMLIDREYIVEEIVGGLAAPRFIPFSRASSDFALYADLIAAIEGKYAFNQERANEIITEEMEALGAEMGSDGKWTFEGEPVTLIALIRTEDERMAIGDYVSNELEEIGFTIDRQYKISSDASPCWLREQTNVGCFHFYTGGWITTAISRDEGTNFGFFYTPLGRSNPLWQTYTPSDEFMAVVEPLWNNEFSSMDERRELFAEALDLALQDSSRIWLYDAFSLIPRRSNVLVAADLSGGVSGSQLWAYTLRREGEVGGSMNVAHSDLLVDPWNPVAGSNWTQDQMLAQATQDEALLINPWTGLQMPNRIESAEVQVVEGLPVRVGEDSDWVTLEFVGEIPVPEDAWADWDAETQQFITVGEKFPDGATAQSMVRVTYPADLYETVTWHDGSPISPADFVLNIITTFDFAKEASPYYDAAQVPAVEAFLATFKGTRIVSTDPLVIETWTDAYQLDAENAVVGTTHWWPNYTYGPAPWHTIAIGLMADGGGLATFSADKAAELEVEWLSYISGPALEILSAQLDTAATDGFVPYEPTLSQFIGDDEVATRYANLQEFHRRRGHFWVGTGPYFLQRAFPVEGTIILERYPDFPDLATKWASFGPAPLAQVAIEGPSQVTIGDEAAFTVSLTSEAGDAMAAEDFERVQYLVFDAEGNLVTQGEATAGEGGTFTITLSGEDTGALAEGSNRLSVVAVSRLVAIPATGVLEFVTTP